MDVPSDAFRTCGIMIELPLLGFGAKTDIAAADARILADDVHSGRYALMHGTKFGPKTS